MTEKNIKFEYIETFTNSAEFGIITQIEFFDHAISKKENLGGYYIVHDEDFVYNPRISSTALVGPINRNKLGRNGVISPLYTVFRPYSIDKIYLEYYFKGNYWHSYMKFNGDSGARSDRFSIKDELFFQMIIPFPEMCEQKKIGRYMAKIDDLITLHQREYEKLLNFKKAMLEKMFPKNGKDKPEIRFKGFTDAWEQRKLRDVAIFNPKTELPEWFEYVDLESVVGTEMISHRTEMKKTAPSRAQRLAQYGDIFFQTVRPYQKNNYLFEMNDSQFVFSTGYAQLRPFIDRQFLLCAVQTELFLKMVLDRCTGTSYPAINSNDLEDIDTCAPNDEEEQMKIGLVFKKLDNLITLHQRECNG